jgi:hypothetical protein
MSKHMYTLTSMHTHVCTHTCMHADVCYATADNQWFVRVGRITPEGPQLESDEWKLLCGSFAPQRPAAPLMYPSPSAMALPAVLVMGEVRFFCDS